MKNLSKYAAALALGLILLTLPACNTTKGAGKDIEKAGAGLEKAAEKHGAD